MNIIMENTGRFKNVMILIIYLLIIYFINFFVKMYSPM